MCETAVGCIHGRERQNLSDSRQRTGRLEAHWRQRLAPKASELNAICSSELVPALFMALSTRMLTARDTLPPECFADGAFVHAQLVGEFHQRDSALVASNDRVDICGFQSFLLARPDWRIFVTNLRLVTLVLRSH